MATILVVDDHLHMRLLMQHILERAGHRVLTAENGDEALALLGEHPEIAGVVSDISMPVMDGFTLLERLKERPEAPPTILVTARGLEEDREHAQSLGAVDVITKPFSSRGLADAVAQALTQS